MTSPRPRPDKPIQSVALRISFKADKKTAAAVRQLFPSAKVHNGMCEVKIETEQPSEAVEKTRALLEKIRSFH
jgi:hypothetical protein